MLSEQVRNAVNQAISKHDWTYETIGVAAGVPKTCVWDFAKGAASSVETVDRLAAWLGARLTKLKIPPAPERRPRGRPKRVP